MKLSSEVVKIFDIEPFDVGDETCQLRLEITRNISTNTYKGEVYRLEFYRLQPTFPLTEGRQHDALLYVPDDGFCASDLSGESIQEVIEKFEKTFDRFFAPIKHSQDG